MTGAVSLARAKSNVSPGKQRRMRAIGAARAIEPAPMVLAISATLDVSPGKHVSAFSGQRGPKASGRTLAEALNAACLHVSPGKHHETPHGRATEWARFYRITAPRQPIYTPNCSPEVPNTTERGFRELCNARRVSPGKHASASSTEPVSHVLVPSGHCLQVTHTSRARSRPVGPDATCAVQMLVKHTAHRQACCLPLYVSPGKRA